MCDVCGRANLFTTPEARERLFEEAGVVFVKDSSANKCGVICSSFEIASSMLMTSDEFKKDKVTHSSVVDNTYPKVSIYISIYLVI